MRTIIAGSRDVDDYQHLLETIKESEFEITTVISGGARGVDLLGERYAKENNIPLEVFPAEWDEYGKSAGYIRNLQMANSAEALIAICKDMSSGTMNMIKIAQEKKLKVFSKCNDIYFS